MAKGDGEPSFFSVANGSRWGNFRKLRSKVQPQAAVSNFCHGWAWHPRAWAVAGYNVYMQRECQPVCVCALLRSVSGERQPSTNYHRHLPAHIHNHKPINVVVDSSSSSSFSWLQVARTSEVKIIGPQFRGVPLLVRHASKQLKVS